MKQAANEDFLDKRQSKVCVVFSAGYLRRSFESGRFTLKPYEHQKWKAHSVIKTAYAEVTCNETENVYCIRLQLHANSHA